MTKLNPVFGVITLDNKELEIFMSFGLLDELCRIVGEIDSVPFIGVSHEMRRQVLAAVFAERTKSGKIIKSVDWEDLELDPDTVIRLLAWVAEHVLNFFMLQLNTLKELTSKNEDQLKALQS